MIKYVVKESNVHPNVLSFALKELETIVPKCKNLSVSFRTCDRDKMRTRETKIHYFDDQKLIDEILKALYIRYGTTNKWHCLAGPRAVFPDLCRPKSFIYVECLEARQKDGTIIDRHEVYRIFIYSDKACW